MGISQKVDKAMRDYSREIEQGDPRQFGIPKSKTPKGGSGCSVIAAIIVSIVAAVVVAWVALV